MGAAEHDGVRRRRPLEQRAEIELRGGGRDRGLRPALLGERDEHLAGPLHYAHLASEGLNGTGVGLALHRAFGGDHRDAPVARGGDGSSRARLDHPDHRHRRERFCQRGKRHGGGRVAGDHHHLHALGDQEPRRLQRIGLHRLGAFGAVGEAGGVAEIDESLLRQPRSQRAQHREPAHAGVEDPDRARIRQARRSRIPRNRDRGSAGRPR